MKHNKWIRQIWAWALLVCLLLQGVPAPAFATETETTEISEEFVIPEDAIYLSAPEDILQLASSCVSDAWSRDKVFVLKNDIDLGGVAFEAIPSFGGMFLGQGFTITGLCLDSEQNAQGFFRYLQKTAVVDGLHLQGLVQPAKTGNLDIGGLVGVNSGTVKNCTFTGTVSGTERIGGIAGRNKVSGIIENCTVSGTVYGDHYIGGIAGENMGVIRFCTNLAEVNTHVDHNSVSAALPGLSLEDFTVRESISDATNIGGIAGTSSGVIRACKNLANIGYEKMGYNVGGIAGSQIGYITQCENHGSISGSDGVGGIVGQFKPNVVLNMAENHIDDLMDQMIGMLSSVSGMMGTVQGTVDSVSNTKDRLEDSVDMLKKPENWDPDSVSAAVNDMNSSVKQMYQDMLASGAKMTDQAQTMMGSMNGMVGAMEKLNQGLNIKILDISKNDTPEDTLAKISSCQNFGQVHGETYAGGIAGSADMEDTTAHEDVEGQLNLSTEGELVMRLVIRDCRNAGTVSAAKQYAGGIAGKMVIGAIFGGMNTGNLDALAANYVGGIAGRSETYLADCFSRSVLAGNQYVGGIAGYGTEVTGCHAVTEIAAATKFAGGILGAAAQLPDEEPGLILENRYYLAGKDLGGIDGICYDGATAPMTIQEFLAAENLDPSFRTVTVRFVAQDQEDVVMTVELGKSLTIGKVPQLQTQEQELYHWVLCPGVTAETLSMGETAAVQYLSQERLTNILFDQTYQAVFDAKNAVVASVETVETGRPLALAVGAFDADTVLHLNGITAQIPAANGATMLEAWKVTLADAGIQKLHYHMPEGMETERTVLYVKNASGNWVQRSFTVEGSYMIFPFAPGESSFALAALPEEKLPVTNFVIAAETAALALIVGIAIGKYRAKKKGYAVKTKAE